MNIDVSLEIKRNGHVLAFVFDLPSACGWGKTIDYAVSKLEKDITWTCQKMKVKQLRN